MRKYKVYFIISTIWVFVLCLNCSFAQEQSSVKLPVPRMTGGKPLMEALSKRQSIRSFSSKELSSQTLSDLLWAAFGINRKDSGKRTAPSAINRQEIDIYAATKQGVFVYDAKNNQLNPVVSEDIRNVIGRQAFIKDAPVVLVYVADYRRMGGQDAQNDFYPAADTGFISQNVYLFCASEGLATVVMGMVNKEALSKKMGLAQEQKIILAQPVGYSL